MRRSRKILVAIAFLFASTEFATNLWGRVIRVVGGDTFTFLTEDKRQIQIRLKISVN